MRLDKYLKVSRLIKRRTVANEACDKFVNRFTMVEQLAMERGIDMKSASLTQLDSLWEEVKKIQRKK